MCDSPPSTKITSGAPVTKDESDEPALPPVVPRRPFPPNSSPWRSVGDVSASSLRSLPSTSSSPSMERADNLHFTLPRPSRPHRLVPVSVSSPQICAVCEDYIVTPRCSAYYCSRCQILLHFTCSRLVARTGRPSCTRSDASPCHSRPEPTIPMDPDLTDTPASLSAISTAMQPLSEWNRFQVAYWLTVFGLGRFVILFLKRRVTGHLLLQLAPYSPELDQVVDPFARQALRRAIMVLAGLQPCAGDDDSATNVPDVTSRSVETTATNEEHDLKICSFLQEVACAVCRLPLLGLSRQGFQCSSCGMIFHRVCKVRVPLPTCLKCLPPTHFAVSMNSTEVDTLDYDHLPVRLAPYISCYFGAALNKQPLDTHCGVPSFLLTCTRAIERLATESISPSSNTSDPIDLVSAYQQSASTSTLIDLHTTYSNRLPTDDPYLDIDVVRLTQLMKAFLRDLPTPVIPENNYQAFCQLASLDQIGDELHISVRTFLSNLPEQHRNCLLHVMRHFDFIWSHQMKLEGFTSQDDFHSSFTTNSHTNPQLPRSCQPISWLLVFRQILIRPPWAQLLDLTTSLDVHLRALNVLFLSTSTQPLDRRLSVLHIGPVMSRPPVRPPADKATDTALTDSVAQHPDSDAYRVDIVSVPAPSSTSVSAVSYPSRDTPPSPASQAENMRDLRTRDWYWADVTQAEVCDIMAGLADGFFLVRDASESSAGAFTLVIRLRGENKLYRIYHRGDYFGVVDPPPPIFRLVSSLIDYYRSHTILAHETVLLRPTSRLHYRFSSASHVSTPPVPVKTSLAVSSTVTTSLRQSASTSCLNADVSASHLSKERLLAELTRTDFDLGQCDSRIRELVALGRTTIQSKEEAAKLTKGNQKLQVWLQQQKARLSEYAVMKESLAPHQHLVEERLRDAARQITESNALFASSSIKYQDILTEQVQIYARQRKLKRKCQEIRHALKDQGVPQELFPGGGDTASLAPTSRVSDTTDHVTDPRHTSTSPMQSDSFPSHLSMVGAEYDNAVSPDLNLIINRDNWFVTDISRDRAEEILNPKPPGTFLIRASSEEQKLALSVRLSDCVRHCLIHQSEGRYGFVPQSCGFDSLEALVCYYHVNSLKQHNPLLTITLRYPAFSPVIQP
ncbi:unnamed protein product [Dicrocoelium dendriticum]|nr:unnamed protein product [Dicrocoelium dendriticum]